ncbi:hypothetical protein JCM10449v2_006288 [Rhodotorula kratochvilovae]
MASPSSSSWSPHLAQGYAAYPGQPAHTHAHPQLGGKGIPPPVSAPAYHPASSPASSSRYSTLGPPPDLTERYRIKAKYLKMQKRYFRAIETRKDLEVELAEKEAKVETLQDEVDLIIDQIHDSDYAHLVPARDDLFSDDEEEDDEDGAAQVKAEEDEEDEGEAGAARSRGAAKRSLEDEEDERRRQLEEKYGIDGSRQNVTHAPPAPEPEPAAAAPIPVYDAAPAPAPAAEGPPQKRLKLTFGGTGGASAALG